MKVLDDLMLDHDKTIGDKDPAELNPYEVDNEGNGIPSTHELPNNHSRKASGHHDESEESKGNMTPTLIQ